MSRARNVQQSALLQNNNAESPQNSSNPLTPKLRKGAKAKYIIEQHPILDGTGKVVRTRHTGDTYHCHFYVKDEKKWVRKSLHTKELGRALAEGRKLMIDTLARLQAGEKLFAKTYRDVVAEFLKEKQEEANAALITKGRVVTIRCALEWAIKFAGGSDKKINSIEGNDWKRYYVWRKTQKQSVRDNTLVNERSMISSFFMFADQKQYISRKNIPIFDKALSKGRDIERRDAFTEPELNRVNAILRYFEKHGANQKEKEQRKFIRDFFMISTNTGLRFGEMRKLKWHKVTILKETDAHGLPLCEIKLERADTKNRKARTVQGMRGDIFNRIKEYSRHTKPTDYVFVNNETGEQLSKQVYYRLWKEIKQRAELEGNDKLTWYSTRHTYATFRLLYAKDLDIITLAKNMGTSVKFIEDHYGHVETAQKRTELVSKKAPSKSR